MPYSAEELGKALMAAHQAGDVASARKLAAAYRAAKAASAPPSAKHISPQSQANIAADEAAYRDTAPKSTLERLAIGNTSGFANIGRHVGNLVGAVSDEDLAAANKLDAPLANTGAGAVGRFVGESAALGPLGEIGSGVRAAAGASKLARLATTLGEGAAAGQLTEGDALGGAAAAGALGVAGKGIKRLIKGAVRSPAAQILIDAGADLTPGQLRPGSMTSRLESAGKSAPLGIGAGVEKARERGLAGAEPALFEKILGRRPTGAKPQDWINEAYAHTDSLYGAGKGFKVDKPQFGQLAKDLNNDISSVIAKSPLSSDQAAKLKLEIERNVRKVWDNPTSEQVLKTVSQLRKDIRKGRLGAAADSDSRAYADALEGAESAFVKLRDRVVPPEARAKLSQADAVYGDVKVLEDAIGKSPADRFRSSALKSALKKSMSKRQYAQGGGGRIREISDAVAEIENIQGGPLQRSTPQRNSALGGIVNDIATVAGVPYALAAQTGVGRRFARGATIGQRAGRMAAGGTRRLRRSLSQLGRLGTYGASAPESDQQE